MNLTTDFIIIHLKEKNNLPSILWPGYRRHITSKIACIKKQTKLQYYLKVFSSVCLTLNIVIFTCLHRYSKYKQDQ